MSYRQYEDDQLIGEPVELRAPVLRKLVGRTIEYLERGWYRKRVGVLHEVSGHNLKIDNDWRWKPYIRKMTVHPEESTDVQ